MDVPGKLSVDDLDDVARLVGSRWSELRSLLPVAPGLFLVGAIIWATVLGLLGHTTPNWRAIGVIWAVIVAITIWTFISVRRERGNDLAKLNATLPETVTLGADGPTWRVSGAQVTLQWTDVKGWRERGRVISLDGPAAPLIILPLANLSEPERQALRSVLRSVIPASE